MRYFTKFLEKAYELINPAYARDRRMERFEELAISGALKQMTGSEIERMFRIKKEFPDLESV